MTGSLFAPGGLIQITAPRIFTSGSLTVDNPDGAAGTILIQSEDFHLPGARLSAQGPTAGSIYLGETKTLTATVTLTQSQLIDPNQGGGTGFGTIILPLSTGNIVVTKPGDNLFAADSGAVYLYDGATLGLISALYGTQASDQAGNGGVTALTNGNWVVSSFSWDNGAATNVGAATWGSGISGAGGAISATNSLVGTITNDQVGVNGVIALTNGNYVVASASWDNGATSNAGAVTWGNGASGIVGAISAANSLVGTTIGDNVGVSVTTLTNGNYVVNSNHWSNGAANNAGAVTWGNGTVGITGPVSAANSIVGTKVGDFIGTNGITALANGNYVISSTLWDNGAATDAGAATWGNGLGGTVGVVSAANSLVGTKVNDLIGNGGIQVLTNSNYIVLSPNWDNGGVAAAGAVTWGNGASGTVGVVSAANSLVGTTTNDQVGTTIAGLTNGNYVVRSPNWNNGAVASAGAITWGNGASGIVGAISAANSLVGTTASDRIGSFAVTALTNGNYVVSSPHWHNGAATDAGAVTWGNGLGGTVGAISAANSLVGTAANDQAGAFGVTALTNGNYVVISPAWNNGVIVSAGAATWGNGLGGTVGAVSAANSLVGTAANDLVSLFGVTALTNGNYVVMSPDWNNGAAASAGAVTWGNGASGTVGAVSAANSLVGTVTNDQVGTSITALTNGNYVVLSPNWDNGASANAGAATWGNGLGGTVGAVSAANSLVGTAANDVVSLYGVVALTNGNYVVRSAGWHNGASANAGAVTWGNGLGGTFGEVSAANSLVGTTAGDLVGVGGVLNFGVVYAVVSYAWDNGGLTNAGAVSIGDPASGLVGAVSSSNSLVGESSSTGLFSSTVQFNTLYGYVVAGFPSESTSGRVRVSTAYPPVPPTPGNHSVSAHRLSRGVYRFTRAIGNVYQLWDTLTFGSLLYPEPCPIFENKKGCSQASTIQ